MSFPRPFLVARCTRSAVTGLVLSICALGCGASPALRVATSGDYPPFSAATSYGAIVGFDTDIAGEFTRDTGRSLYFVPLRWPRLSQDADAREFDLAMSGITVRSDRLPHMLFSRPYVITGAVVAVRRERSAELGTLEQIDRPGVRLAVNRGGHLEQVARRHFRHAEVLTVDDNRTLPDRVLRDEVDGAVSEELEVATWPDAFAVVGPFTRDRKAYAATPDRADLLRQLNEWLAARERDGWLNGERSRWLSPTSVWSADAACFEAIAAAIDLRLQLMPQVAAAKQQRNLPIEDPAQEATVLQQAADWAASADVDPSFAVALFGRLIAAAKDAQRGIDARAVLLPDANLDSLRAAVAFYSRSLIDEIGRCRGSLSRADAEASLETALRRGEALGNEKAALAAELARILAHLDGVAWAPKVEPAVAPAEGTFVEFCIPPNLRFDREGYSVEEMVDGMPLPGRRIDLPSGRTRIAVSSGRHEYRVYVNGSSADPRRSVIAGAPPSRVDLWVPPDQAVTVRVTPAFNATGEFELRWQDVYGAAAGGLETYRGLTRFDVDVEVSAPADSMAPSQCPW